MSRLGDAHLWILRARRIVRNDDALSAQIISYRNLKINIKTTKQQSNVEKSNDKSFKHKIIKQSYRNMNESKQQLSGRKAQHSNRCACMGHRRRRSARHEYLRKRAVHIPPIRLLSDEPIAIAVHDIIRYRRALCYRAEN